MNSTLDKLLPGIAAKLNLAVDLLLLVLGLAFCMHGNGAQIALLSGWGIAGWLVLAVTCLRVYSPLTPRTVLDNIALRALSTGSVTLVVVIAGQPQGFDALTFAAVFFLSGALGRVALFRPIARMERTQENVLIVGTGALALATAERVARETHRRVVGFVRYKDEPAAADNMPFAQGEVSAPILGDASQLLDVLSDYPVQEVYVAGRVLKQGLEMQDVVSTCERIGMPFAMPVHALRFERAHLLLKAPADDGFLHYCSMEAKPFQYALKRLMDIVASGLALVFLSPLMLGVALGIKLTSAGPIFFVQERVGLHGARFGLLKFRSMVVNAEALKQTLEQANEQSGPVFKMKNDPRITAIGRFIRKYSIDELPQLINILRGDMTIVGPRPALPKEVAQYKIWQRRRLSVRPGLTCYWQVGGRNAIGFEEWMRLDLRYVDGWNLSVDLRLILQTFPVVLAGRGAS